MKHKPSNAGAAALPGRVLGAVALGLASTTTQNPAHADGAGRCSWLHQLHASADARMGGRVPVSGSLLAAVRGTIGSVMTGKGHASSIALHT